jgi:hypothetical protein
MPARGTAHPCLPGERRTSVRRECAVAASARQRCRDAVHSRSSSSLRRTLRISRTARSAQWEPVTLGLPAAPKRCAANEYLLSSLRAPRACTPATPRTPSAPSTAAHARRAAPRSAAAAAPTCRSGRARATPTRPTRCACKAQTYHFAADSRHRTRTAHAPAPAPHRTAWERLALSHAVEFA